MKVVTVLVGSSLLADVKGLWRKNSDTLGMMPDGGFDDHAERKRILGLVDGSELQGYLMYRVSRNRANIVHLCVAESCRGKGASRLLIDALIESTRHLIGIELRCRRDFAVSALWPKLGFVPIGERRGRALAGSILTVWAMDYGKPTLLSKRSQSRVLEAVIDANVLIDLADRRNTESLGLCADWMQDELQLCITDEIFNDFNRQSDDAKRIARFSDAEAYPRLTCSPLEYKNAESRLKPLLPASKTPRDESDVRHLIRAVAAGAKVFISRDGPVLQYAESIYAATGMSIVRPSELISRVDELAREEEYQRTLLAGTRQVLHQRVSVVEDRAIDAIVGPNESKRDLQNQLRQFLADPLRYSCEQISFATGEILAFYVVDAQSEFHRVPLFRVAATNLTGTLSRAILTTLLRDVVKKKRCGLIISESSMVPLQKGACEDIGFREGPNGWIKLTICGIHDQFELAKIVASSEVNDPIVQCFTESLNHPLTSHVESELEHALWPAKFRRSLQHNFIVPIRPDFAEALFDEHLARQTLHGADIDLALNSESVYYRSARQQIVKYPGRILWYISNTGKRSGAKSIRACSRIAEVVVDKPKAVFRRFQRLGVYEWSDVFTTAGNDLDKRVMAIRFHDTELLRPVKWDAFQKVLKANNVRTNLESPVSISSKVFEEIYALAFDSPQVC